MNFHCFSSEQLVVRHLSRRVPGNYPRGLLGRTGSHDSEGALFLLLRALLFSSAVSFFFQILNKYALGDAGAGLSSDRVLHQQELPRAQRAKNTNPVVPLQGHPHEGGHEHRPPVRQTGRSGCLTPSPHLSTLITSTKAMAALARRLALHLPEDLL